MGISLHEFKSLVLDRLLALLWRQWPAIGVPGHGDVEERRVVDPEALLLLSLTVARFDARLFDEILGWLKVNGSFLNVQRLGNLEKRYDFRGKAQLSAVSYLLSKESNGPVKWGRLSAAYFVEKPEPLFFMKNGRPLPVPDDHSPEFGAHGLLRGPIRPRGHAQLFPAKGMRRFCCG